MIGLFYYLRVVKAMYFDPSDQERELSIKDPLGVKILLSLNGLSLLGLGIFPSGLMAYCILAFK